MLSPSVLDAVRAEIAEHESALAKLRDIERLTLELVPSAAPPALPAPQSPRPSRPERPRSSRNGAGARRGRAEVEERKRAILAVLATRGPLSPSAIAEATGDNPSNVKTALYALRQSREVVASGSTWSRTYDIAGRENGSAPIANRENGSAPSAAPEVSPRVRRQLERETPEDSEPTLEDRVLAEVKRVGGWVKLSEVEYQLRRQRVDVDRGELERAAARLSTHGLVERDPGGGLRLPERPLEQAALDAAGVDSL